LAKKCQMNFLPRRRGESEIKGGGGEHWGKSMFGKRAHSHLTREGQEGGGKGGKNNLTPRGQKEKKEPTVVLE